MGQRNLLRLLTTKVLSASLLMLGLLLSDRAAAQQVTIATGLPSSASSGSSSAPSVVTFCINNNRTTPVTLKAIDHYMSTSNANTVWKLYYSSTSLAGQPNVTTWTLIDSVTGPTVTGTGIYTLFTTLSFPIPASTNYRFALQTTAGIINYGGATTTPNSQSVAGIDLYRGNYTIGTANVGYAGSASAPPFSPRFFCGTVYLDTTVGNCSGTPAIPVVATPPMTTASPICSGSTKALSVSYSSAPGLSFQWQSSSSASGPWTNVTTGTGATTVNYTTGPLSSTTFFRMGVTCSTSNITSYSTAYQVLVGTPQPGTITGNNTYCPGDVATYSVPFVAGTSYAWTLPSGWTGPTTGNSVAVTPGASSTGTATISVTATSSCGPVSIARTMSITRGSAPATPAGIAGNNNICFNTTQTYSVNPVGGAASYIWTLPSGWSGTSNTNSITVTANSTPGNVTVRAINGCGQSAPSTLAVTIITSLANPGTITGKDTVCSGSLQTYTINPVSGASSYVWTLPSGWSGTTTGTSIQAFAGTSSGTLSVTAYVACATSPSSSKPVNVVTTVSPAVSISAPPTALCQGAPVTITASPSFPGPSPVYQWRKNGNNVIAFGNTYTSSSLVPGDSVQVVMTSNAACATNMTVSSNVLSPNITPSVTPGVSINTVPPIFVCKGTPVTFTTTSNGTGATPSYQWYKNGLPIASATGTSYTDAGLNHADTLTIKMTTSAICATMPEATSNKVGVTVTDQVTPTVSISVAPSDIVTPGQSLTFTATQSHGGATPDFQWLKNGVVIPFETGTTYTSNTLRPGDHISVRMLSYEPCASPDLVMSNAIVLKSTLSVGGAGSRDGSVTLYPNPNSGRFTIAASWGAANSGKEVRVDVLNVMGQVVHHIALTPSGSKWQAEVSLPADIADGQYMLRISTDDGMNTSLPFILNR